MHHHLQLHTQTEELLRGRSVQSVARLNHLNYHHYISYCYITTNEPQNPPHHANGGLPCERQRTRPTQLDDRARRSYHASAATVAPQSIQERDFQIQLRDPPLTLLHHRAQQTQLRRQLQSVRVDACRRELGRYHFNVHSPRYSPNRTKIGTFAGIFSTFRRTVHLPANHPNHHTGHQF